MTESTDQFEVIKEGGRHGYKVVVAVYKNEGKHVVLAAPTLKALKEFWYEVVGVPVVEERVQHCILLKDRTFMKEPA